MMEKELVERLDDAAKVARLREQHDLAELLDEAEGELELAFDLIETLDTPAARRYMARHSSPVEHNRKDRQTALLEWTAKRIHDASWQRRLTMLLAAARFVDGRDSVPVDQALIAMAWNAPHPDMAEPDRVMGAGGFARIGNEYRRLHNVISATPQNP